MSVSTIAAISTPLSVGGLAVIRISGENALGIADKIFKPFKSSSKKLPSEMDGYTCAYGRVVCDGQTLDDVVLTVFKAPHSYTGLDTVEISCHGGVYLARKILRLVFDSGAVPAEAGEFTKLAFLNGKLGLTQAEAVMDILGAEGDAALKSARLIKEGGMYKKIKSVSNSLVKLLGSLAAWADYPDEDIPKTDGKTVLETMKKAAADIGQILNDYDAGRVLRNCRQTERRKVNSYERTFGVRPLDRHHRRRHHPRRHRGNRPLRRRQAEALRHGRHARHLGRGGGNRRGACEEKT